RRGRTGGDAHLGRRARPAHRRGRGGRHWIRRHLRGSRRRVTDLAAFLSEHGEAIARTTLRAYPPVYSARNRDDWGFDLTRLRRRPLGAQGDAIRAVALSLQRHRGTNLVGEMGTGKTTIATGAAYLAGFRRVLVLTPPHLVRK